MSMVDCRTMRTAIWLKQNSRRKWLWTVETGLGPKNHTERTILLQSIVLIAICRKYLRWSMGFCSVFCQTITWTYIQLLVSYITCINIHTKYKYTYNLICLFILKYFIIKTDTLTTAFASIYYLPKSLLLSFSWSRNYYITQMPVH